MNVPRRILRYVVKLGSILSLALFLLVIAFWIRAQWRNDWFKFHHTSLKSSTWRGVTVVTTRSYIYISWEAFYFDRPSRAVRYAKLLDRTGFFTHYAPPSAPPEWLLRDSFWKRIGFGFHFESMTPDYAGDEEDRRYLYHYTYGNVGFPYWFALILLACAGLPLIFHIRASQLRRYRIRNNQCLKCGYDLRDTPTRCPECGEVREAVSGRDAGMGVGSSDAHPARR